MIELNNKENAVRSPATSAEVGFHLQNHRPFVYRARTLRLGSVHSFSVKKMKRSLTVVGSRRQRKKVKKTKLSEEMVRVIVESLTMVEDVIDVTTAVSGALKPEGKSVFRC